MAENFDGIDTGRKVAVTKRDPTRHSLTRAHTTGELITNSAPRGSLTSSNADGSFMSLGRSAESKSSNQPHEKQDSPPQRLGADERGETPGKEREGESPVPETKDKGTLLDTLYQRLQEREAREPNPDDVITILGAKRDERGLKPGQPEYDVLLASGVDEESLARGNIKRGQLLAAGYVFHNKLGAGEKAIISGTFEDPDNPGEEVDFSNRVLLTREELRKVYAYQLAHPDIYGLHGEDIDEVRKDMLSFLYDATHMPPLTSEMYFLQEALPTDEEKAGFIGIHAREQSAFDSFWKEQIEAYRQAHPETEESGSAILGKIQSGEWSEAFDRIIENNDRDWETVNRYWKDQVAAYKQAHPDTKDNDLQILFLVQKGFAEAFCSDIYIYPEEDQFQREKRGHVVRHMNSKLRRGKLNGAPSPFLESGFIFTDNPDVEAFPNGKSGTKGSRRINMVNVHLMGAHPDFQGLNEMGGSRDQIYMPAGEYVDEFFIKDSSQREATHAAEAVSLQKTPIGEIMTQFQERLIDIAHKWKDAQPEERAALMAFKVESKQLDTDQGEKDEWL